MALVDEDFTPSMTNKEVDTIIGKNLKGRRMIVGLSQTDLADRLGITFQQVQKYEKGMNRLSGSRMWACADILNCTPGYFFNGLESSANTLDPAQVALMEYRDSWQGLDLCRAMSQIDDPALRKQIVSLAKAIADSLPSGD